MGIKRQENELKFYSKLNENFEVPDQPPKCKWHRDLNNSGVFPHTKQDWKRNFKIYPNISAAIGNTPLVKLNKIPQEAGLKCNVYAKCEYLNPGGSAKDRVAKRMVEDAERHGLLKPGMTVIESSSGNAGIALSLQAAIKGYKAIIIISEYSVISPEKLAVLNALGAQIVRTPVAADLDSPEGFIGAATRIHKQIPNSIILDQFTNPASPLAHYDTTAEELWDQCDQKIDMVVLGAGTGGTITGIGRKMKELSAKTKIVGVDPAGSSIALPEELNRTDENFFEVDGIGFCFVSPVLDRSVVDLWMKTTDQESMVMARRLIKEEGLLCGNSSGAILSAALKAAKDLNADQNVVVILPDGVRNYLSTYLLDQWMESRNYQKPLNKKNHWWWDKAVTQINLNNNMFIAKENDTCGEILNIIENNQLNHIGVLGANGGLLGIVAKREIVNKLLGKDILPSDQIEQIVLRQYSKADSKATLGLISRILEVQDYVAIVEKEDYGSNRTEKLLGIVQNLDVLNYVKTYEELQNGYVKK